MSSQFKLDVRMSPCQKLTAVVSWSVWVVSKQVQKKRTELTTMVNQATGTQQKTVLCPSSIHPSWYASGCEFTKSG